MKRCLLSGPILVSAGYGVHVRQIMYALTQKFDVASRAIRWGECAFLSEATPEKQFIINTIMKTAHWQQNKIPPHISVQVTVPPEFEKIAPFNIGVTAGIETDRCKPEWILKMNEMNLCVVPSTFLKQMFEQTMYKGNDGTVLKIEVPIEVIPESVDTTLFNNIKDPERDKDLDIPITTSFNFLTVGQWGIGAADRKNIALLIKTFKEAFVDHPDKEKIGLILRINSINGTLIDEDYTRKRIQDIVKDYPKDPKIYLIHGHMKDEELARLYKDSRVKVFITLTHGEGWGLPIEEAAACDLPIIATGWSGHEDIVNLGKNVKLSYKLVDVPFENDLFQKGCRWAEVDPEEVKNHMRKIYSKYDVPKSWAVSLGEKVRTEFSIKAVEDRYFKLFEKYHLLDEEEQKESENKVADAIFGKAEDLENEIVK